MSAENKGAGAFYEGERDWLARVVDDLLNDELKLVYADWLEERGDERSCFLRKFVAASASMNPDDFPSVDEESETWLELIGYRLLSKIAERGARELKEPTLRDRRCA